VGYLCDVVPRGMLLDTREILAESSGECIYCYCNNATLTAQTFWQRFPGDFWGISETPCSPP
jgi:hypothetical protein